MEPGVDQILTFLETVHPYDTLPPDERARVARSFGRTEMSAGDRIYSVGDALTGIFLVGSGRVEVTDAHGSPVSNLQARNSFGERGFLRDGIAQTNARMIEAGVILTLPGAELTRLIDSHVSFARFFNRARPAEGRAQDMATMRVDALMTRNPVQVGPDLPAAEVARLMRDRHVSSVAVVSEGVLAGIVTVRDLAARVVAEGLPGSTPVGDVMTRNPVALAPEALVSDVLHLMLERRIGHVPVLRGGALVGIVTQTDLTRFQAVSSAQLVRDAAECDSAEAMAHVTARIPRLLSQLVASHNAHEVVTRLITDICDTVTRRLLTLAEKHLGPAPVPWLWLACGSQGRQEQTGVSDQDNCLILDDRATDEDLRYFHDFARFVSDGLNTAGYFYCPGDMMATNPRWCARVSTWRRYFQGWIANPDPEAQMLASVMFDLRPIGGTVSLFEGLQAETLAGASRNSIFVAHMISNSLKHQPPLGLIRGFATIRTGEHRHHIDMKHNGVVPVMDLARVYALQGRLTAVNTRARILAAEDAGVVSVSGARDLIAAYDLIADLRLENQAALVKAGRKPDNFLAPHDLSDFERSHLRDAFVVVRTMQSALGQRAGSLT